MKHAFQITKSLFALAAFVLVIATGMVSFASTARADQVGPDARAWVDALRQAVRAGTVQNEVVDPVSNIIDRHTRGVLDEISYDQAQIWADTILEGEYVAEPEVRVDSIELLQSGDRFLGYRVTYSSVAFDISECNPQRDMSLCRAGRIQESSYVSPDLQAWVRDDRDYADFVAD